jgi:hypothetical protein
MVEPVETYVQGIPVYERRMENDFLIDRHEQKTLTYTGIINTTTQQSTHSRTSALFESPRAAASRAFSRAAAES